MVKKTTKRKKKEKKEYYINPFNGRKEKCMV